MKVDTKRGQLHGQVRPPAGCILALRSRTFIAQGRARRSDIKRHTRLGAEFEGRVTDCSCELPEATPWSLSCDAMMFQLKSGQRFNCVLSGIIGTSVWLSPFPPTTTLYLAFFTPLRAGAVDIATMHFVLCLLTSLFCILQLQSFVPSAFASQYVLILMSFSALCHAWRTKLIHAHTFGSINYQRQSEFVDVLWSGRLNEPYLTAQISSPANSHVLCHQHGGPFSLVRLRARPYSVIWHSPISSRCKYRTFLEEPPFEVESHDRS